MVQEWIDLDEFPGYAISMRGLVVNTRTGRLLRILSNAQQSAYVCMMRDGRQCKRSIAKLVALSFLPLPKYQAFDTPINLNGDRLNNDVSNLMWRPRWFAMRYHHQFETWSVVDGEVQELNSGAIFENALAAGVAYGLLASEVYNSAWNYTYHGDTSSVVWPTGQQFCFSPKTPISPHLKRGL